MVIRINSKSVFIQLIFLAGYSLSYAQGILNAPNIPILPPTSPADSIIQDFKRITDADLTKSSSSGDKVSGAVKKNQLDTNLLNQVSLGKSLIGEDCEISAAKDIEQTTLNQVSKITCNGKALGNLLAQSSLPQPNSTNSEELILAIKKQYIASQASPVISTKMQCAPLKWLEIEQKLLDFQVAVMPCTLNNGGWPHLVLMRSEENQLFVTEGPPALFQVLLESLRVQTSKTEPIVMSSNQQVAILQKIWGKPVRLVSPNDTALFEQILAQARVANAADNFDQSETLFRKALKIQTQLLGEDSEALIDSLLNLALSASNNGRFEESVGLFTRVETLVQRSSDNKFKARYLTYLGYDAANRREYLDALKYAHQATSEWRAILELDKTLVDQANEDETFVKIDLGELALALNFEANMSLRNAELVGAQAQTLEAFEILDKKNNFPAYWRSDVLVTMGDVAIAQGRVTTAETYYQAALAIQRQLYGESKSTVKILMKIGTARQKEGLFTNAIITFREAIQIAKKLPNGYAGIFTPDQLSFYADAAIDLSKNLLSDLDKQGLFAEVFDAFQMQKSSAVEKTLLMSSVRMMSSNPQMRDLVEKLQSAERIRDTDKTQLAAETALLDDQRSKLVEDRLIAQIEQKNQEILRYQQELQANHPNYLELTKTKPVLINELQSFLTPNEAIALFLLGTQSSYIQLITRSEIQLAKIEQGDQAIHEDVKSLRKALEIEGGSVKEFDLNKSYTVYKALFGQVEKQFKNIDHLIVVPTGPLASLPFSILVTKPIAGVDYSKAEWLVKQLAITHTPSLKSFFEKRSTVQLQQASKAFLGFGNPVLAKLQESSLVSGAQAVMTSKSNAPSPIKPNMKTAAVISKNTLVTNLPTAVANEEPQVIEAGKIVCRDGGPIPASILTAIPSLPDTANEIIQVSKSLGGNGVTDIYLGAQANEVNFRNLNLTDYRVIYFATHGLLPGELKCQSEPGLVLTPPGQAAKDKFEDGVLDASEISQFKLNANLVVLSACNTAGGGGKFGGDSLTGLVEAFFYAGAQNLLVSHWSVPSTATMQLMTQVFANLGSNFSNGSAASLQKAQQQMVQNSLTAHPVFWGAFVLIGDGAVEGTGSKKMVSQVQPINIVRHVVSQVTLQQSN